MHQVLANPPSPSPRRRRRRTPIVLLVVAAVLGIGFGRFAWLRITREPTPRPHYYEDLILALDPAPDDRAIAEQAMDLLGSPPWMWDEAPTDFFFETGVTTRPAVAAEWANRSRDILTVVQGPWDAARPDMTAAAAIFSWDGFEEARRTLGDSVRNGWREKIDLSTGQLSPLWTYSDWSRWLVAHSRWIREAQGDPAIVVEDWLIALRLSRQARRLRLAASHSTAMDGDVAREMLLAAREGMGDVDTAALLREVDAILGPLEPPSQLLAGEHLWMHHYLESVFVQEGGDWLAVNAAAAYSYWGSGGSPSGQRVSRLWNLTSPLFHDLATSRANVDTYIASLNVCTDIAICQQAKQLNGIFVPLPPGALDGFSRLASGCGCYSFDYNIHALQNAYIARCELDAAVTMLALEQYRQAEGAYPDQLDQLIPRYLHRMPVDYGDRQPLRYRVEGQEYVLYSIGLNGNDDGGVAAGNRPDDFHDDENRDVVFSLASREELEE